jgi:hypothetical protein
MMSLIKITPKCRPDYALKLKEEVIASPGDYLLIAEDGSVSVVHEAFFTTQYVPQANSKQLGPQLKRAKYKKCENGLTHLGNIILAFGPMDNGEFHKQIPTRKINEITGINCVPRMREMVGNGLVEIVGRVGPEKLYSLSDKGVQLNKKLRGM